ncbi:outer membrane lipoprotein-sorting protein [Oleispira antarctica]|uniref:Outer membrane lipoprotein-sorting protein n=1 Tax=Oleispira antarctica TaxID=188908 RepID=A0A1Y5HSX2_OLEAN|nr:outer membrane lipoprotein-sorting protein [Oleispira antarctica]
MKKNKWIAAGVLALATYAQFASAAVTVQQAERLKGELTPIGAERAGNGKDIPPWRGGLTVPTMDYKKAGQHHPNPYPQDKPLFVITAANKDKHKKHLTEGQMTLFETYPDSFKMPIYKTRRTGAAPEWIYDNTYKNAIRAELNENGAGLRYAYGGTPFPLAKSGLEVIWNHITRWRGVFLSRRASEVAVQKNGNFSLVTVQQDIFFNYNNPDATIDDLNNILFYYLSFTKAPARLAGGAVLLHETIDQVEEARQAWGYNAGQRRVRRAPNLAYDTPIAAADGLRYADDTDMFNGAPDRYNWKLIGKKEIYIPYNNYELSSNNLTYKQILKPGHINPDYTRYEKHRVWVVEANLKEGARHVYQKRRFFIDEDTWSIAVADQYDSAGDLWRISMAYLKNYYEVPVTWTTLDVFHDVKARRYHVQGLDNEERSTIDFSLAIPGSQYFTPSALRRRGKR